MIIQQLGKLLIFLGLSIAAIGAIVLAASQFKWLRLGKLPGDISYEKPGLSFYFPITTMILISLVLSAIFWIVSAFRR